jgi:Tfp pilus assembly ATPase PilU
MMPRIGRAPHMYTLDDLLELVCAEKAQALELHTEAPPVLVVANERHTIEGPPVTPENAELLLHTIADSRRRWELRDKGSLELIYAFRGSATFQVRITVTEENISIDLQPQTR